MSRSDRLTQLMGVAASLARDPSDDTADRLLEACRAAHQRDPSPQWLLARAFVQLTARRLTEARETLEPMAGGTGDSTVWLVLARLDLLEGDPNAAAQRLDQARQNRPDDELLSGWADVYGQLARSGNMAPSLSIRSMKAQRPGTIWMLLAATYVMAKPDAPPEAVLVDMLVLDPLSLSLADAVAQLHGSSPAGKLPTTLAQLHESTEMGTDALEQARNFGAIHRAAIVRAFPTLFVKHLELWQKLLDTL